jgi:hypothetical protein
MLKSSAVRKVTRATIFAASLSIFASLSPSPMAQQSGAQQQTVRPPAGGTVDVATAAAIAAEGELKATVRTFQGDNPSAVYRYYWWHDSCYLALSIGKLSVGHVRLLPPLVAQRPREFVGLASPTVCERNGADAETVRRFPASSEKENRNAPGIGGT